MLYHACRMIAREASIYAGALETSISDGGVFDHESRVGLASLNITVDNEPEGGLWAEAEEEVVPEVSLAPQPPPGPSPSFVAHLSHEIVEREVNEAGAHPILVCRRCGAWSNCAINFRKDALGGLCQGPQHEPLRRQRERVHSGKHPITRNKSTIGPPHFPTGAQLAFLDKQNGRTAGNFAPPPVVLPNLPAVPSAFTPPPPGRILQCFGIRISEIDQYVEWARAAQSVRKHKNVDPEASSDEDT